MRLTTTSYPLAVYQYPDLETFILRYFEGSVAYHNPTVRASYTVPTGKMLHVSHIHSYIARREQGTIYGRAGVTIEVTLDGTVWQELVYTGDPLYQIFDYLNETIPTDLYLTDGQGIRIKTADYTNGGSCDWFIAIVGFTFNA